MRGLAFALGHQSLRAQLRAPPESNVNSITFRERNPPRPKPVIWCQIALQFVSRVTDFVRIYFLLRLKFLRAFDCRPALVRSGVPEFENRRGKANAALNSAVLPRDKFCSAKLKRHAFYADDQTLIFNMDVNSALDLLAEHEVIVNCIVTSPPFYGQRNYEVSGQIGLEAHPSKYIEKLVQTFNRCKPILANNGSAWINIGDTYWSGKGEHTDWPFS